MSKTKTICKTCKHSKTEYDGYFTNDYYCKKVTWLGLFQLIKDPNIQPRWCPLRANPESPLSKGQRGYEPW